MRRILPLALLFSLLVITSAEAGPLRCAGGKLFKKGKALGRFVVKVLPPYGR